MSNSSDSRTWSALHIIQNFLDWMTYETDIYISVENQQRIDQFLESLPKSEK